MGERGTKGVSKFIGIKMGRRKSRKRESNGFRKSKSKVDNNGDKMSPRKLRRTGGRVTKQ